MVGPDIARASRAHCRSSFNQSSAATNSSSCSGLASVAEAPQSARQPRASPFGSTSSARRASSMARCVSPAQGVRPRQRSRAPSGSRAAARGPSVRYSQDSPMSSEARAAGSEVREQPRTQAPAGWRRPDFITISRTERAVPTLPALDEIAGKVDLRLNLSVLRILRDSPTRRFDHRRRAE